MKMELGDKFDFANKRAGELALEGQKKNQNKKVLIGWIYSNKRHHISTKSKL